MLLSKHVCPCEQWPVDDALLLVRVQARDEKIGNKLLGNVMSTGIIY
jgi:hypothetical protein